MRIMPVKPVTHNKYSDMKRYTCAFLICLLVLSAWASPAATFAEWGTQAEDGGDDAVYDPFAHLGEDGVRPEEEHGY